MSTERRGVRILIVEDEPKLAAVMADYLHIEGFETTSISDGAEVIPFIRTTPPSLMLLDLMLPGRNGMDICREVRQFSTLPVIILTARVDEADRLRGLEIGADDYVYKPFSPREVVARVKAILRRAAPPALTAAPVATGLEVDQQFHSARLDGEELKLTPVELRMLALLMKSPGRIFPRDYLLNQLYDDHRVVTDRTIDSHIKNLRRKLQVVRPDSEPIVSVYGVGYRLELSRALFSARSVWRSVTNIQALAALLSSMKARMTSLKLRSAASPSFSPRSVSHAPGQLPTIFSIFGSGCQSISAATSSPATSFSASTISVTLTESPGMLTTGHVPSSACSSSQPAISDSIACFGDSSHKRTSPPTGHTARSPFSGSRMMPLANDDAAAFGLPGRTLMVGRRSTRPSTNPRRE